MKYRRFAPLVAILLAAAGGMSAFADTFTLDQVTGVVTPSSRGAANTTWFGWETFNEPANRAEPINDSTPDIGTTAAGVNVKTLNNEDHVTGSGNIYVSGTDHTLYEQVTVATDGTVGTAGTTTVIAQFVTAFGEFPGPITVSSINGVLPVVVRGVNAVGASQVWAKWQIPGNAASYVFTINGPAGLLNVSIDRIVVDTHWNATTPQPDLAIAASPPTFKIDQVAGVVVPTTRGNANTTWFGWETFCEPGFDNVPINDTTPDIGTTATGVSFVTTNAQDHLSSTRNLYVASGTLAEEVTVVTDGTVGSTGFTTIIAQAVTAFGGFPSSSLSFGSIEGVAPQVVVTNNINGSGQAWAKWKIPGNKATYTFTVTGPANLSGWSFDRFVVDTLFSPTAYQPDTLIAGNPALNVALDQVPDVLAPSSRGNLHTTHFGWEVFTNPEANAVAPINDTTPDIGNTATAGVSIVTTNGEDHLSSTNNIYVGSNGQKLAELVTVVTNAPPGTPATGTGSGSTTIIAQAVAQAGAIRTPIYFGPINGISPTYVTGTNSAGKGHIWALWTIPGNPSSSYSFAITSDTVTGPAVSISIDRLVVDTVWRPSGAQPDKVNATTPVLATALGSVAGVVKPSTRGNLRTTHFGWETLNNIGNRVMGVSVIDDNTPDIGYTTTAGAKFETTNGQGHLLGSGNLYFLGGNLAERITVPTNGTVGATGSTTIILQIASSAGNPTGENAFAGPITATIDGVAPVSVAQGVDSTGTGQYWAKWQLVGNQATYLLDLAGPPDQAHFSFDRVVVDTLFNSAASTFQGDTMAELPVSIPTTSPLAVGGVGSVYSATIAATGGTAPLTFSLSAGTVPAGLSLSSEGVLSGTPTTVGVSNFTVRVTDVNGLTVTKAFATTITTTPSITTVSPLVTSLVSTPFTATLAATEGTAPYTWTLSAGTLQTGLTLSTAGVLSGTPTATGASSVTVQVADANGLTATKVFDLLITTSPSITSTSPLTLGVTGVSYNATLEATAGTAPYSWTLSSGTLPAGLSLSPSGVISGTTAFVGTSTFSVLVTDANNFTATKEFSVTFQNLAITSASPLPGAVKGMPYSFSFAGSGGIGARTFALVGTLPTGLNFNAGVITGTPTVAAATPTTTSFTVQLTDSSTYMVSKEFSITVFDKLQKPVVNPIGPVITTIGTEISYPTVTATNYPSAFTITGLPKGLVYKVVTDKVTKITTATISGRTALSGVFNAQIVAKNSPGGSSNTFTARITVKAVDSSLIGTYAGLISRDATANTSLGSKFSLVTTTNGSYSLKVTTGAKTLSTTGFLNATAPHISAPNYAGGALSLTLGSELLTGTHGAATVSGWRTPWNATNNPASTREGYYSFAIDPVGAPDEAIPQGSGFATFTASAAGVVTIAGKTADGQSITGSDLLGPDGQFGVYTSLYAAKGSILGQLVLNEDEFGEFFGNTVSGALTWHKAATTGKVYAAAFAAPVNLTAEGNYLAASAKEVAVLGLPNTGVTNQLVFVNGGVATFAATQPNFFFTFSDENKVVPGVDNPGKVTLTINAATGAVSGKFTLTEATAANTRKDVAFQGQIVRLTDGTTKAVGYFLLPQLAPSTATLSGGIEIKQVVAP